jgi:uncharacterized membrane protein YoaK (UPF0700 family)
MPQTSNHLPPQFAIGIGFAAALSMVAGMTDAIGFMRTTNYVSFMSGNTTLVAIALGHGAWHTALPLVLVVPSFVVGNALGGVVVMLTQGRQMPLLLLVAALLALATLGLGKGTPLPALLAMAVAMGAVNAAMQRVGTMAIGVSYVTGALSRFGLGLGRRLTGERQPYWALPLVPWFGMLCGAVLGGVLETRMQSYALWIPCGATALLALSSHALPLAWQRGFTTGGPAGSPKSSTG